MRRAAALAAIVIFRACVTNANAADANSFNAHCATCHQPNARGVPGFYPPLADSIGNVLRVKRGRTYLIDVVLNGMAGPVEIKGTSYTGLMPSQAASLSDEEIASALNYVLTKFNAAELPKDFAPITAAEVHAARATKVPATRMPDERKALMSELQKSRATTGATR